MDICFFFNQKKQIFVKLTGLIVFLFLIFLNLNTYSFEQTMILLSIFLLFCLLFFDYGEISRSAFLGMLILITLVGSLFRLYLAFTKYGNFDMDSYEIVSEIVRHGGNVYNETTRYNYSPVWFLVLGSLKNLYYFFNTVFSYHFIVRSFLTGIDVLILIVIVLISKIEGFSYAKTLKAGILFFLNPISILLTGYHGQFDNLAIFFVLSGLFFFLKSQKEENTLKYLAFSLVSFGFILKHIVLGQFLSFVLNAFNKFWKICLLISITFCIFLLLFVPYVSTGKAGIVNNVLYYSSIPGYYGLSSVFPGNLVKILFFFGVVLYPFLITRRDLCTQFLMDSLFFLTCTPGMGIQYLILPLAFGALRFSPWFYLYSFFATLYILGAATNLSIPGFNLIPAQVIWLLCLFWMMYFHASLIRKPCNILKEYVTVKKPY